MATVVLAGARRRRWLEFGMIGGHHPNPGRPYKTPNRGESLAIFFSWLFMVWMTFWNWNSSLGGIYAVTYADRPDLYLASLQLSQSYCCSLNQCQKQVLGLFPAPFALFSAIGGPFKEWNFELIVPFGCRSLCPGVCFWLLWSLYLVDLVKTSTTNHFSSSIRPFFSDWRTIQRVKFWADLSVWMPPSLPLRLFLILVELLFGWFG